MQIYNWEGYNISYLDDIRKPEFSPIRVTFSDADDSTKRFSKHLVEYYKLVEGSWIYIREPEFRKLVNDKKFNRDLTEVLK